MFKSKTLFIVGAGASYEVGLPIGTGLKQMIASRLDFYFEGRELSHGDDAIMGALRRHIFDNEPDPKTTPYVLAGRNISAALPQAISIDNFLDAHRDDARINICGKLGIVSSILQAERESKLYFDMFNSESFPTELGGAWHSLFFQRLTEGVPKADLNTIFDNVSFITFNYDRCIEHFLYNALKIYYGIEEGLASEIMSRLKVYHPYGRVGYLPWQEGYVPTVPFGGDRDRYDDLLTLAGQIKTFTEQIADGDDLRAIRREVEEAEVIIFLGFAYADQNMELLKPAKRSQALRVFATAKGISKSDCEVVEEQIADLLFRDRNTLQTGGIDDFKFELRNDLTCSELFVEYWRSITR
ncbi:hypothetical protein [Microvirga sp. P5_D2]